MLSIAHQKVYIRNHVHSQVAEMRCAWTAFHFLESASTASWRSSLVGLVCIVCGPAVKFVASKHDRHMHLKYHEKDLVSTSKCPLSQTLIVYSNARARSATISFSSFSLPSSAYKWLRCFLKKNGHHLRSKQSFEHDSQPRKAVMQAAVAVDTVKIRVSRER